MVFFCDPFEVEFGGKAHGHHGHKKHKKRGCRSKSRSDSHSHSRSSSSSSSSSSSRSRSRSRSRSFKRKDKKDKKGHKHGHKKHGHGHGFGGPEFHGHAGLEFGPFAGRGGFGIGRRGRGGFGPGHRDHPAHGFGPFAGHGGFGGHGRRGFGPEHHGHWSESEAHEHGGHEVGPFSRRGGFGRHGHGHRHDGHHHGRDPRAFWPMFPGTGRRGCPASAKKPKKNAFEVKVDVTGYTLEELNVKTVNKNIVVEGKHEDANDSRSFVRRYELLESVKPEEVTCKMNAEGFLVISAPIPEKPSTTNERSIPITMAEPSAPEDEVDAPVVDLEDDEGTAPLVN